MRARIRSIKPELLTDEDLWDLDVANPDMHITRSFEGIWMYADREGRFEWRPRALGALILPYWEGDFACVMNTLADGGFIRRYRVGSREYGVVVNFHKHQSPNNKELPSDLPTPPNESEERVDEQDLNARRTRDARVEIQKESEEDAFQLGSSDEEIQKATFGNGKGIGNGKGSGSSRVCANEGQPAPANDQVRPAEPDLKVRSAGHPVPAADFTAERQQVVFRREYERVAKSVPSMGGKQVGSFHAAVVRTAELQRRDPEQLFCEALLAWLKRPHGEAEKRAPYACFCQAWGEITGKHTGVRNVRGGFVAPAPAEAFKHMPKTDAEAEDQLDQIFGAHTRIEGASP